MKYVEEYNTFAIAAPTYDFYGDGQRENILAIHIAMILDGDYEAPTKPAPFFERYYKYKLDRDMTATEIIDQFTDVEFLVYDLDKNLDSVIKSLPVK